MTTKENLIYCISSIITNFGTALSYFTVVIFLSKIQLPNETSILLGGYTLVVMVSTFIGGSFLDKKNKLNYLIFFQIFAGIILFILGFYIENINSTPTVILMLFFFRSC